MNKWKFLGLIVFISVPAWAAPAPHSASLNAKEVMTRNESARKLQDLQSEATLTTATADDNEKVKNFTWWRKLTSDQIHYNTMVRFHLPAEVRNEGILFLEHEQGENEVLLYLPNFKKIRRLESQQQSGNFMGSEFSYSDMATPHVDDYQYQMIHASESCGLEKLSCYVIESTPTSDSIRNRIGYNKLKVWVRSDNFMQIKGEFYNSTGELMKKMEASEIEMVDPVQKKWMAKNIRIENEKTHRSTRLQFKKVQVNRGISDSIFTQQNLQLVR